MKIDRLIAIIMLLLEREKMSAEELAKIFEVSPRTIYRDLNSINQAGIPVTAISGPGNGISILKSYKVEKRLFSTSDITTLLMALGSIQSNLPETYPIKLKPSNLPWNSNFCFASIIEISGVRKAAGRSSLIVYYSKVKIGTFRDTVWLARTFGLSKFYGYTIFAF